MNITHCVGGMNRQSLGGLGIPQVYVQPDVGDNKNNTDYIDFNNKVVSVCLKVVIMQSQTST